MTSGLPTCVPWFSHSSSRRFSPPLPHPPVSSAALPPLSSSLLCAPTLFFTCPLISSVPLFVFPHIYTSWHGLRCIVLPSRACLRWWWKQARHKVDTVDPWVPRWTRFSVPNFKNHVGGWSKREKEWSGFLLHRKKFRNCPFTNYLVSILALVILFFWPSFSRHLVRFILVSSPPSPICITVSMTFLKGSHKKLTPGLRRSRGLRKPQVGRGFAPGVIRTRSLCRQIEGLRVGVSGGGGGFPRPSALYH